MNYVFGPISSKRLGQSLGVDLLPPKSCTWNCVYCQLGRTKQFVTERKEFFPRQEILDEIRQAIQTGSEIDWITFVGSGETTLYKGIDWLIDEVKKLTTIPVAVITNGSLLHIPEVRRELIHADAVLPSLNAGSAELFETIDRPAPGYSFQQHIEGLRQFRSEYTGKLWIEVMLIAGLNDSVEALEAIAAVLQLLKPDMVHLVLPTRPSPEGFVQVPDSDAVARAVFILSKAAQVVHPSKGNMDLGGSGDLLKTVIAIATRHPLQRSELRKALEDYFAGDTEKARMKMEEIFASGRFDIVRRGGEVYWIIRQGPDSE